MVIGSRSYEGVGSLSELALSGKSKYPNPFFDIASEYLPTNIYSMFEMAEFLWNTMPPFQEVGSKTVRYFITEVDVSGGDDIQRKKVKEFYDETLHIKQELAAIGDDYMVYGQAFASLFKPFDRILTCPDCKTSLSVNTPEFKWKFQASSTDPHFVATCPKCNCGEKRFENKDLVSKDYKRIKIVRWNPKHIHISFHPIANQREYYLDLSLNGLLVQRVKSGIHFFLNNTPWDLVVAICKGNQLIRFSPDTLYHMARPSLSGMTDFRGWAIPPLLTSFKLAYYVQLLRRYDESFVMDFIMPFRILYPETRTQNADPLGSLNMQDFVFKMQTMVERKRKNITDIQIAPCAVGYQLLGGEGKAMSPKDNIAAAMTDILNNSGYSAEMYSGNLAWQTAPVALRLFERRWGTLVDGYNDFLRWLHAELTKLLRWDSDVRCVMRSVTLADDLERKALGLQAAAGGDISKDTAYRPFGFDFKDEQRKVLEEQRLIAKLQQEAADQDQASQLQGGGGGAGGDPSQQAGYSVTMDDVRSQAQDLAYQLVVQVPESQRRSQLLKIKQTNPTLHALTLQAMNELRQSMASQGQAMVLQQEQANAQQGAPQQKQASALPSPEGLRLFLLSEMNMIDRPYLRKVACDCHDPVVRKAFSLLYKTVVGMENL